MKTLALLVLVAIVALYSVCTPDGGDDTAYSQDEDNVRDPDID